MQNGTARKASTSDKRRVRTREALIRAGMSLFGHGPSDAVSIDDIVKAAGTSKQTFYNHFVDKQALLADILHAVRARYEALCFQVNEGETDAARRSARALCVYARQTIDDPEGGHFVARMILDDLGLGDMNRGVVGDLELGLAQGRYSLPVLETGVAYIFGITQALVARILLCNDLSMATAIAQQFSMLMLRALGVDAREAEMISSQAADQIVRRGFDHLPPSQSAPSL
ncbi:TetR/AcrR family transcriptional regulator [Sphingomonadaceae bacterium G21617-S1]|jgi:AcrR family transcriptional regulator|uniref:TetR/AcrR family transcriptional regulator n=1 Tax=Rhizorhabdus sp. TaxID=1968843 RepID=UPI00120CAA2B|nr:TetR/AcrR family transcriptional regulator [Rhizorhabdus sp.]MBD3760383.1 TetR/AcrR family transcriptional regulator [Rhizorhabdus sp.]MCZ4340085.1 TetR/AcrR family transcriptional regulator [Sphingomonadaceae bacterium G21617-S1]TAK08552.1 MAG: TetR/AcrR family transcriptional regulator [Rhizorhabdus sp.]